MHLVKLLCNFEPGVKLRALNMLICISFRSSFSGTGRVSDFARLLRECIKNLGAFRDLWSGICAVDDFSTYSEALNRNPPSLNAVASLK